MEAKSSRLVASTGPGGSWWLDVVDLSAKFVATEALSEVMLMSSLCGGSDVVVLLAKLAIDTLDDPCWFCVWLEVTVWES